MGQHEVRLPVLLFTFLGAPVAWSLHFLLIYFLVALLCTTGRQEADLAVTLATIPFAAISVAAGVVAYRAWRVRRESVGWELTLAEPGGRTSFFLVMGVLGSVLFSALIIAEAIPVFFVPACPPGHP